MYFPTTHWSLLAKATLHGETEARSALAELCASYWRPINQFVRSRGFGEAEAEDLTQDFLLHVLEKSVFTRANRLQGKFRSFLLGALVRFLGDALDRRNALKRGGDLQRVSLEVVEVNGELADAFPGSDGVTAFDREWALTILEAALRNLRDEYMAAQREGAFCVLKHFLPGESAPLSYETASAQLGLSLPAFKSEVHRLRRRLRMLVRERVAQTVSAPHEIDDEMAHLQQVLMDKESEFRLPC